MKRMRVFLGTLMSLGVGDASTSFPGVDNLDNVESVIGYSHPNTKKPFLQVLRAFQRLFRQGR